MGAAGVVRTSALLVVRAASLRCRSHNFEFPPTLNKEKKQRTVFVVAGEEKTMRSENQRSAYVRETVLHLIHIRLQYHFFFAKSVLASPEYLIRLIVYMYHYC